MSRNYKCLSQNIFSHEKYALVPIRDEDKYTIMQWRNEQMYHLRQAKPLTKEDQDNYFDGVVANLFKQEYPEQLLFSYLENDVLIGYGGLVHIDWESKNAEVSFLMDTKYIPQEKVYLPVFLRLINKFAFEELGFNKIYGYAYDIRMHLYKYLLQNRYILEARLRNHYWFEGKYVDVVIHSKFKDN